MSDWPSYRMARDLAGTVFPVSETVILQLAKKNGIGRKMGRAIVFSPDDCNQLYEVLPCPSSSLSGQSRPTGSSVALSGESALKKVLGRLSDPSLRKSGRRGRRSSSHNPSTVVALPARSRRLP